MVRVWRSILINFHRWAAGEKEAASSEERLLRYFLKVATPFALLLLILLQATALLPIRVIIDTVQPC